MKQENELRKHYLLNEWVIIAEGRAKRPQDFEFQKPKNKIDSKKNCPFCPGNEGKTPHETLRIEKKGKWHVRVFPNLFAALKEHKNIRQEKGLLEKITPHGFHEVVVECPEHGREFADLSGKEIGQVLKAYAARFRELRKKKGVSYVLVLKNHGRECGASRSHNHSQIIGFPFVPPVPAEEEKASGKFFESTGKCAYCEVARTEAKSKRKIFENKGFLVLAPFASRWPYETLVLGKKHASNFSEFSEKDFIELSEALKKLFTAYREAFKGMPYNLVIHQSIKETSFSHFHIEIMPNIHKIYGGIEKGAGIILNEVAPEKAAKELGKKIK